MATQITFEQAMTRLEQIVATLESGRCTLDESMKLFEEGAKLTAFCQKALRSAEQKIVKTRYTDEEIEKIVAATAETHLLTHRELEVFCELLKGKKQSEIGYYLGISISTVKDNAGRIYGKLGVANKDELFIKIDSKLRMS